MIKSAYSNKFIRTYMPNIMQTNVLDVEKKVELCVCTVFKMALSIYEPPRGKTNNVVSDQV